MKKIIAAAVTSMLIPMATFAAPQNGGWTLQTCTVSQIQNNLGVCSKIDMPNPPRDVQVKVRTKSTMGGLSGAGPAVVVLVVGGIIAASSGGGGTNGTN
jgi:hypothetical protein